MNNLFDKHEKLMSFLYFWGNGDFRDSVFLRNVMDNIDYIETFVRNIHFHVTDLMDFYQLLWFFAFKKMAEFIDSYNVDDSVKQRVKTISKEIPDGSGAFIEYVNANYKTIFEKKSHVKIDWDSVCEPVLELVYTQFSKGINSDVFDYIGEKNSSYILSGFESYQNYFRSNKDQFERLFRNLENTSFIGDLIYADVLTKLNVDFDKEFVKEKADFICKRALKKMEEKGLDSDNEEIMQLAMLLDEYFKLARHYKLNCVADYTIYKRKLDRTLDDYTRKHGVKFDLGDINVLPIIQELQASASPLKFLNLTHVKDHDLLTNQLDKFFDVQQTSNLTEAFPVLGNPRSEKYPYYKQQYMEFFLTLYGCVLSTIFDDAKLSPEFATYLQLVCDEVEKRYFNGEIKFSVEMEGAFEFIQNIIALSNDAHAKHPLVKALENGCCVNLCGTMEKLLRNVRIKQNKNICYIDPDRDALFKILNDKKTPLNLSPGLLYCLKFYMCKEFNDDLPPRDLPGKNIRNVQMHNREGKYENTNYRDALILFYLNLNLINELFVKVTEEK